MLRKVIAAAVVGVLFAGVAFADEIRAVITKVEGDNVTFAPLEGRGKKATKGPEKTLPAPGAKVVRGKFNKETKSFEAGKDLKNGLQHKLFSNPSGKGVRALIVTDEGNKKITEIRVLGGGGKKKKNK